MITDQVQQGYQEGLIALAYGLPVEAFNILLREQEALEEYEFCAGMKKALDAWLLKKDFLYCRANIREDLQREDYNGKL